MGVESAYARATPPKAFSAPGPYCTAITPIFSPRLALLRTSAMLMMVRSVRPMIGRMPSPAHVSINGLCRKAIRY